MTKRGNEKKFSRDPKGSAPTKTTTTTTTNSADPVCTPLKPLPTLFKVLLVGFALWLGALLTLYFQTVYPLRHEASGTPAAAATRPGASALPSAPR